MCSITCSCMQHAGACLHPYETASASVCFHCPAIPPTICCQPYSSEMDSVSVERTSADEVWVTVVATLAYPLKRETFERSAVLLHVFENLDLGVPTCIQTPSGYMEAWLMFVSGRFIHARSTHASMLTLLKVCTSPRVFELVGWCACCAGQYPGVHAVSANAAA